MFLNFGSIIIVIIVKETFSLQQDEPIHQHLGEDLETSIGPLNLKASEPLGKLRVVRLEVEVVEVGGWFGSGNPYRGNPQNLSVLLHIFWGLDVQYKNGDVSWLKAVIC